MVLRKILSRNEEQDTVQLILYGSEQQVRREFIKACKGLEIVKGYTLYFKIRRGTSRMVAYIIKYERRAEK